MTPRDWFDYASSAERISAACAALLGPNAMGTPRGMAPDATPDQIAREAHRLWRNKIHQTPCPMGYYSQPIRTVADRLPIWC